MSETPQEPRWRMIRVRSETLQALQAEIDLLCSAVDAGRCADPGIDPEPINPQTRGISLDRMITIMLADRIGHRERRKRSDKARRSTKE